MTKLRRICDDFMVVIGVFFFSKIGPTIIIKTGSVWLSLPVCYCVQAVATFPNAAALETTGQPGVRTQHTAVSERRRELSDG